MSAVNGVRIRDDEPIERAIKRFTKTCERGGVLSDLKKFRHFEKPSEEKRRKLNAAKRKSIRAERRKEFRGKRR